MKQALQVKEDSNVVPVANSMDKLIELAVSGNAPIESLQKLLDMKERVDAQRARVDFFNALSQFQSICPVITKTKKGHNCKYAPIETIVQAIVPSLKACGLTYRFEQKAVDNAIEITCIINHVNGHSESMSLMGMPDTSGSKNAIQAMGSTVQYLRRYTLCGALGIVTADEDNDGGKPQETITEQQAADIEALIDEVKADKPNMLKWLNVESIEQIPASRYSEVIKRLEAKRK